MKPMTLDISKYGDVRFKSETRGKNVYVHFIIYTGVEE